MRGYGLETWLPLLNLPGWGRCSVAGRVYSVRVCIITATAQYHRAGQRQQQHLTQLTFTGGVGGVKQSAVVARGASLVGFFIDLYVIVIRNTFLFCTRYHVVA